MSYNKYKLPKDKKNKERYPHDIQPENIFTPLFYDMTLQRTIGNQEVQHLYKQGEILAKLFVNQPGDVYEQEADRIARQIVNMGDKEVQLKTSETKIQKKGSSFGEESVSVQTEAEITSIKGKGQPLEPKIRDYFQPRFGVDLKDVRVHTDSNADKLARAVRARAFTLGNDVVFAKGEYKPETHEGKRLVAHELTHVLQQKNQNIYRKDDGESGEDANIKDRINEALEGWGGDEAAILDLTAETTDEEKQLILNDPDLMEKLANSLSREGMLQVLDNLNAPITDRLAKASEGWGTDEAAILDLTAEATDEEKQLILNDPDLIEKLAKNLSRESMLTVLNNIDALVTDKLYMAMEGWGVDEAAIMDLTAGATDEEKQLILNDPDLMGKLADCLSRESMLQILSNLDAPVIDKIKAALAGWGADVSAIRELVRNATAAEVNAITGDPNLLSLMASDISVPDMLDIFQAGGVDFKTLIELSFDPWKAKLSHIQPLIDSAADAELQAVWSDAALMSQAHSVLGEQSYLNFVIALEMFQPGTVAHTTSGDADSEIQATLAAYVVDAIAGGRQISEMVAVVDTPDWDRAGTAHYGSTVWYGGKNNAINGFVDRKGRVWIHMDRGNPGTMIHEAVHKYSDNALIYISQPLNEGVTEYFTRLVCAAMAPPIVGRLNYQSNYDCVVVLETLVGEATLADAYFDGDVNALKDAFIGVKSRSDWRDFIGHTKNNNWIDATILATP